MSVSREYAAKLEMAVLISWLMKETPLISLCQPKPHKCNNLHRRRRVTRLSEPLSVRYLVAMARVGTSKKRKEKSRNKNEIRNNAAGESLVLHANTDTAACTTNKLEMRSSTRGIRVYCQVRAVTSLRHHI